MNRKNRKNNTEFETLAYQGGKYVSLGTFSTIERATEGLTNQSTYDDVAYKDHYEVNEYRDNEHYNTMYFDCLVN